MTSRSTNPSAALPHLQSISSSSSNNNNDVPVLLLSNIQTLVQLEQSLTTTLTKTKPLLSLPTPKSISQAKQILALAKTYSTRTSAPPGWNPSLPVVHFCTPSPYPHQLRGGSLGALQLQLVKEEKVFKKRKIVELEQEHKKRMELDLMKKKDSEDVTSKDAKKKEILEGDYKNIHKNTNTNNNSNHNRNHADVGEITMNLSSSSSSGSSSGSGSEEEDNDSQSDASESEE